MIKGKIIDIKQDGTAVITATVPLDLIIHRKVKEVYIDLIDSRNLSDKQRKMCYALIKAISDYTGENIESQKTQLKLDFTADRVDTLADKIFSLSNAPMSLVAEFQRYLVNLILEYDIPTKFSLLEYVDDIEQYVYMCVTHKKCCICGKHADLHHLNGSTVGMGSDRTKVCHLGREVISLCREHHTEYHKVGHSEFMSKYHLTSGVIADKTICKLYKLKEN